MVVTEPFRKTKCQHQQQEFCNVELLGLPFVEVRRPSMENFDRNKYTGRWYEQAFHDYTQFTETYDVTLDIELSKVVLGGPFFS